MSNDVHLTAWEGDPCSGSPGKRTYIGCGRPERVALFWLCCFRLTDLKGVHDRGFMSDPCCSMDKAIRQFREGIGVLLKVFPLTVENNPSFLFLVGNFVDELERSGAAYLQLETWECDDRLPFLLLFLHAMEGFQNPDVIRRYTEWDLKHWHVAYPMPAKSAVMNWAGALRRLVTVHWSISPRPDFDEAPGDFFDGVLFGESISFATHGVYDIDYEFWQAREAETNGASDMSDPGE